MVSNDYATTLYRSALTIFYRKVEFIVMGGTFMSLPEDYRDYFIRNLHDALSGHSSNDVAEAVKYSEKSKTKCIGITIETRPDYCLKRHLSDMLLYGCTRCLICKNDFKFFFQNFYSYLYYSSSFRFIPKITQFEKTVFPL